MLKSLNTSRWYENAWAAFIFFTRLPFYKLYSPNSESYKAVVEFWPLVGWLTGSVMAAILYFGPMAMPHALAVAAAIVARLLMTGALHEDGLADFCDGFGGGNTRQRILDIMKDSRIGTYGVIAERCESVLALYSVIRDCSYGLLSLVDVPDAGFAFCEFRDSEGYDMLGLRDGSSAVFQTCSFMNNSWEEKWSHFLSMDESSDVTFRDCAFDQRAYYDLTGGMDGMNVTLEAPTVF